jgi:hypothetical protein
VSKSWVEVKALVVSINTGDVGHVQGWCIRALVNVSLGEQPRGLKVALARATTYVYYFALNSWTTVGEFLG